MMAVPEPGAVVMLLSRGVALVAGHLVRRRRGWQVVVGG